jgi:hypothetical protein
MNTIDQTDKCREYVKDRASWGNVALADMIIRLEIRSH